MPRRLRRCWLFGCFLLGDRRVLPKEETCGLGQAPGPCHSNRSWCCHAVVYRPEGSSGNGGCMSLFYWTVHCRNERDQEYTVKVPTSFWYVLFLWIGSAKVLVKVLDNGVNVLSMYYHSR